MRIDICGIGIDVLSFDEVVQNIKKHLTAGKRPEYVVTPNAHHILLLQKDEKFREIYRNAFLSVPDGVSLLWAAKALGTPLKGRVNGTDLMDKLCEICSKKETKIFFLGGRPGAAEQAKHIYEKRHPGIRIVGTHCPPYGFETVSSELEVICRKIKKTRPDLLFVGLGAPKQEYWIYNHYRKLNVRLSIGIGVSFEFVSNMVNRAPVMMQRLGLEWLHRVAVEPRRLCKRYFAGNPEFLWLVLRQRLKNKSI